MVKNGLFNRLMGFNWSGLVPPQYLLANRRFVKVVLEPPDFNPGSWRGAGKVLVDYENKKFWLTTRPRKRNPIRGYGFEIYSSKNGEDYSLKFFMSKEELSELIGKSVRSIEGQQIIKDPLTGMYYLYLSVDTPPRGWETVLLKSDDPTGPWSYVDVVLRRDMDYDRVEARDATIDIVDGLYLAVYKANSGSRVNMALAISSDGINWRKLGVLKLNGESQPDYMLICGKILSSTFGPMMVGMENTTVIKGASVSNKFAAYIIDIFNVNLFKVFEGIWRPGSRYERGDYPIHSYLDIVYDPFRDRVLMYVEAIDPSDIGLNKEIDRVLLYEVSLSSI